jgi:prepilin-type N-terminal cleavage/methylation domain
VAGRTAEADRTGMTARAFTLVEVIVVVVVIGILAAVAIPQFAGASQEGRVATAMMNLKTFRDTLDRRTIDSGGQPPATIDPAWFKGGLIPENPFDAAHPRAVQIAARAYHEPTVLVVPSAPSHGDSHGWWYNPTHGEVWSRVAGFKTSAESLAAFRNVNGTR